MVRKLNQTEKRKMRNRKNIKKHNSGRPRLSVHRSGMHIYAQVIDDVKGHTLVAASTMEKDMKSAMKSGANVAANNFLQILFEEGDVALGHFDHAGAVGVTAGNRRPEVRQTSGYHCTQIPRSVYSNLHVFDPLARKPRADRAVTAN